MNPATANTTASTNPVATPRPAADEVVCVAAPALALPVPEPVALALPVLVEEPLAVALAPALAELLLPAGAAAAIAATLAHEAALFVDASPCVYGRNETAPVLSSCTRAVMPAAYVALASLVTGAANGVVLLFWLDHEY